MLNEQKNGAGGDDDAKSIDKISELDYDSPGRRKERNGANSHGGVIELNQMQDLANGGQTVGNASVEVALKNEKVFYGKDDKKPEMDKDEIDQLMREGKAMWLTNQMVDRPCTVIVVGFIILICMSGAAFGLGYFEMNPQHNREFLIWDDHTTVIYDMKAAGYHAVMKEKGQ